jgi:hypothetical protein
MCHQEVVESDLDRDSAAIDWFSWQPDNPDVSPQFLKDFS